MSADAAAAVVALLTDRRAGLHGVGRSAFRCG